MAKFAEADFALSVRDKDGTTQREHLESAWKQSGQQPIELANAPKCPQAAVYLWDYFIALDNRRTNSGFGVLPLLWSEIDAWARLNRYRLDHWELEAILRLDTLYLVSRAKAEKG